MLGELPFYIFFSDLRQQTGLSLTPTHLADLQRLMLEMHPQEPLEILALCRMLWLQKAEVSDKFNDLFWSHWAQLEAAFEQASSKEKTIEEIPAANEKLSELVEDESLIKDLEEKPEEISNITHPSETRESKQSNESRLKNRGIWLHFEEAVDGINKQNVKQGDFVSDFLDHSFVFTPKYWPLPPRRLQQTWRYMRSEREKAFGENINISATVEKIAAEKIIDRPVYELKFSLKAQDIHILRDYGGSMTPYAEFSGYLTESLVEALKPRRQEIFYFRNYPNEKLYRDKGLSEGYSVLTWLRSLHKYSLIVIISDAGAARNETEPERVNKTRNFLKKLNIQTNRILWLNPLPKGRWVGNSAFYIDLFVTMVSAENEDLQRLPDILKKW